MAIVASTTIEPIMLMEDHRTTRVAQIETNQVAIRLLDDRQPVPLARRSPLRQRRVFRIGESVLLSRLRRVEGHSPPAGVHAGQILEGRNL